MTKITINDTSDVTKNLGLYQLLQNQSMKEVLLNENYAKIDSLFIGKVIDIIDLEPINPSESDCYIVSNVATDVFADYKNHIMVYFNSTYQCIIPKANMIFFVVKKNQFYTFDGTNWNIFDIEITNPLPDIIDNISRMGVNTTSDENNKLSVKSNEVLFSSETGDCRINVNKNELSNTASVIFKNNWIGKAEFGLCNNDNFSLKTSDDNGSWSDAFNIDNNTRNVDFKKNITKNGIEVATVQDISSKNYIINGDFQVWQRGDNMEYKGGAPIYFCDRWFGRRGSSHKGMMVSKQWDDEYKNIVRVQRKEGNSLNGDLNLAQIIESNVVEKMAGKTITFSAFIRLGNGLNDINDKISMIIRTGIVKDQGGNPYGFSTGNKHWGQAISSSEKNIWQKLIFTLTLDSDVKSMLVQFTANNLQGTAGANDYFEIANVKLELGDKATNFEPNDYYEEFRKCLPYFERRHFVDYDAPFCMASKENDYMVYGCILFHKKRKIPSIYINDPTRFRINQYGADILSSDARFVNVSLESARLIVNTADLVSQECILLMSKNDLIIDFDAEV